MRRAMKIRNLFFASALFVSGTLGLWAADSQTPAKKAPEPPPPERKSDEETTGPQRGFQFRNLGPAAGGGRITALVGIPGNPNVIYVGSCSGGVWKTIDGGISFKPVFEDYPASIGAIAIAPS